MPLDIDQVTIDVALGRRVMILGDLLLPPESLTQLAGHVPRHCAEVGRVAGPGRRRHLRPAGRGRHRRRPVPGGRGVAGTRRPHRCARRLRRPPRFAGDPGRRGDAPIRRPGHPPGWTRRHARSRRRPALHDRGRRTARAHPRRHRRRRHDARDRWRHTRRPTPLAGRDGAARRSSPGPALRAVPPALPSPAPLPVGTAVDPGRAGARVAAGVRHRRAGTRLPLAAPTTRPPARLRRNVVLPTPRDDRHRHRAARRPRGGGHRHVAWHLAGPGRRRPSLSVVSRRRAHPGQAHHGARAPHHRW